MRKHRAGYWISKLQTERHQENMRLKKDEKTNIGGNMKKRSIFNHKSIIKVSVLTLILMIIGQLQAYNEYHDTDITSDETWEYWDSGAGEAITHVVTNNISVVDGVHLTIESGCIVEILANFTINGTLTASGFGVNGRIFIEGYLALSGVDSQSDLFNILFTSGAVSVNSCSTANTVFFWDCDFNYSDLLIDNSYARITGCDGSTIEIDNNSSPLIDDSHFTEIEIDNGSWPTIDNCTVDGVGITVRNGSCPFIYDSDFLITSSANAASVYSSSYPTFTGCSFMTSGNGCSAAYIHTAVAYFDSCEFKYSQYGISMYSTSPDSCSATFTNCDINNNSSYGIATHNGSVTSIVIEDSWITANGAHGINSESNISISNTTIANNQGIGLNLAFPDDISLNFSDLTFSDNGIDAIRILPNLVGQLPASNHLNTNASRIYIYGGNYISLSYDAVWPQNSNYYISGGNWEDELVVESGVTLELTAGSELYFNENIGLKIEGSLYADSVSFDRVYGTTGHWRGIHFVENDRASYMEDCEINHAGFSDYANSDYSASIVIDDEIDDSTSVTISGCEITNGIGHGIYVNEADPLIEDTSISNCDSCGIYLDEYTEPDINYCDIEYNGLHGIYLNYYAQPNIFVCSINNNGLYGIFSNQIHFYDYNRGELIDSSIENNSGPALRIPPKMLTDISSVYINGNLNDQQIELSAGIIDTTHTLTNNFEYIFFGAVKVENSGLTIEEGTVLKFDTGTRLQVGSFLTAIGTPTNHITFTSNQVSPAPGDWDYLYLDSGAQASQLTYCDFLYGGSSSNWNGMIYQNSTTVNYSHCNISYSGSSGIRLYSYSIANITDCEIHHNDKIGVFCDTIWEIVEPNISNTSIHNNGDYAIQASANFIKYITNGVNIYDNAINAIKILGYDDPWATDDVETGTWYNHNVPYDIEGNVLILDNEVLTIEAGNTIRFLGEYSITVDGSLLAEGTEVSHIVFTKYPDARTNWKNISFSSPDNVCQLAYCDFSFGGSNANGMIETDDAGIFLQMSDCNVNESISNGLYFANNSSPLLDECSILNNSANGIYLTNNSSPQITNCSVRNNLVDGIHIADGSIPTFGNSLYEWNHIYNNGGYDFYNGTSDIDAEYIYWGTINSTEIDAVIYDKNDDAILGLVNYSPWTNAEHDTEFTTGEIEAPQNVTIAIVGTQVQITWSAVAGATSYKVYSSANPHSGFAEDTAGTFVGESWSASVSNGKQFYYIKAVD